MQKNNQKILKVNAYSKYQIVIANGLHTSVGELILKVSSPCKVAVITDDIVDSLYSNEIISSLTKNNFTVVKYVFPNGEGSKNLDTYAKIINFLAQNELTRTDIIVALGGGVVGDMAGFAAATYLRGIKYVQIPTTLLSQVDSSVGGKTAVDLSKGKNLVGAFKQPSLVLCDIDTLKTLPKEVYLDGLGEVCKYAVLDKKVFNLLGKDEYSLTDLIYLCLDYKRKIVQKDEFEKSKRKLLNLGHTIGHAIEKLGEYKIPHGVAVAMGLKIMLDGARNKGLLSATEYEKIISLINKLGLKMDCPFTKDEILSSIGSDKKRKGNKISLVVPYGVQKVRIVDIALDEVKEYI
jgi:3-dehydroquinate synthase